MFVVFSLEFDKYLFYFIYLLFKYSLIYMIRRIIFYFFSFVIKFFLCLSGFFTKSKILMLLFFPFKSILLYISKNL